MLCFQALCLCLCLCICRCLCLCHCFCLCICVLLWFFIAFIVSFQNMYGHRGLWGLRAEKMIIFEVMTDGHSPIPLIDSAHPVGWAEWKDIFIKKQIVSWLLTCISQPYAWKIEDLRVVSSARFRLLRTWPCLLYQTDHRCEMTQVLFWFDNDFFHD